jgi:hypothetical protein
MGFEVIQLLKCLLSRILIVPKARLSRYLLKIANLCVKGRQVKDSPGFYPGARLVSLLRALVLERPYRIMQSA